MPRYIYRAKNRALKFVEGSVEAESQTAAIARLTNEGVYPLLLTEALAGRDAGVRAVRRRVPGRVLASMSRQLADLLTGGIPLFSALSLLSEQTEHRVLRETIPKVREEVRDGLSLSEALGRHPDAFPPLYVSMIRAGETGSGLDRVLVQLAELAESEMELKHRVAMALVYPMVVVVIGIITVVVLLTYVVPRLAELFAESGQLLPLPTRLLLAISHAVSQWWWLCGLGVVGIVGGVRAFRRSPRGGAWVDRLVLRVPLLGSLVQKAQTARLARNVGAMIGHGVPILQALEVAQATLSNFHMRQAVATAQEAVRDGESLSKALGASRQFPPFVGNLIAVGEESGTLENALLKIASSYERETDRMLQVLTTILEPLLIVLVGLVVMFIVISMLLPIFQLGLVAQ